MSSLLTCILVRTDNVVLQKYEYYIFLSLHMLWFAVVREKKSPKTVSSCCLPRLACTVQLGGVLCGDLSPEPCGRLGDAKSERKASFTRSGRHQGTSYSRGRRGTSSSVSEKALSGEEGSATHLVRRRGRDFLRDTGRKVGNAGQVTCLSCGWPRTATEGNVDCIRAGPC